MKIAFLNIYSGQVYRGAERSISELATRLAKKHHLVVIQGKKEKKPYRTYIIDIPIISKEDASGSIWRKFYLDYWSRRILLFTLKAVPFLWKEKFNIVIPTNGGWQSVICRLLSWLQGSKLVITGRAGKGWDDWFNILCRPDCFIVLSPALLFWAKRHSLGVKITQIPNGVDLSKFSPQIRGKRLELKSPIVITVGALTAWKRLPLVIKAVAKLRNTSLLIVGDGNERAKLEKMGKKLLGKRFMLISASHDEMASIYKAADVFTLPVMPQESFGNVFLEAMACNLPIVAPDDQTRRYIVGKAGFFVDPENRESYAKVIKKAMEIDWGDRPRKQAEKFSWEKVVKDYEKLFEKIR